MLEPRCGRAGSCEAGTRWRGAEVGTSSSPARVRAAVGRSAGDRGHVGRDRGARAQGAEGGGEGVVVAGIKADSRLVGPGDLFVALNSGVDYVQAARGQGAATLVPDDQERALAALATLVRGLSNARVVAVVGSTGKTSTKDILGALCRAVVPTIAAETNLNNEIGVPLTVCRLEPDTEVLITEMGMRGLGQVGELCALARPHTAVVTSIGPEHLELVGSIENVARANAEAIVALPADGTAIVPADAALLEPYLTRSDITIRRFDPSQLARDGERWRFTVGASEVALALPYTQRHMIENTLAALHAYDALGLPLDRAQEGASGIALSRWRGEAVDLPGGGFVVNDAYNANPTSMRAALLDLAERAGSRRRIAILGEMAELGDASASYHRSIGTVVGASVDVLIAIGPLARHYMEPGVAQHALAGASRDGFADLVRPVTRFSSRRPGRSAWKACPRRSRKWRRDGPSLIVGLVADGDRRRDRRPSSSGDAVPASDKRFARRGLLVHRQTGNADDGGPPESSRPPWRCSCSSSRHTMLGMVLSFVTIGCAADRIHRRLPEGVQARRRPFAVGRCSGWCWDHRTASAGSTTRSDTLDTESTSRRSTSTSTSTGSTSRSCSS